MATTYGIPPHTVILDEVTKVVGDKVMKYQIRGTKRYFKRWAPADTAARLLLLKQTVSMVEFEKRVKIQRRITKAHTALKVNDCLVETAAFVQRWDGIISVENKKRLCEDLNCQLKDKLRLGGFRTIGGAMSFIKKHKKR